MITIPECFHCIHYNNGKCPAYPEGIPYKILAENKAGPVELATISFGQRFEITPIQLVTAVSAIANNGTSIQPRIVKQIIDSNGKIKGLKFFAIIDIIRETFDKDVDVIEKAEINKNSKIEKEIEKTGVIVYEK